jgi:hypothetical protein
MGTDTRKSQTGGDREQNQPAGFQQVKDFADAAKSPQLGDLQRGSAE